METSAETSYLNILHILTLNGRNGEYGGPVRVAREHCFELNSRGHTTHIFSGALKGSEPIARPGLSESYVVVKPIIKKLPVSTLWSWKLLSHLTKKIKSVDVVHIHFARDLIPFLAIIISILNRKPFVTQTHGMIIPDSRKSARLVDFFLTKRLIKKSRVNLVLNEVELSAILKLGINVPCKVVPNGIAVPSNHKDRNKSTNRIGFCSRLEKRKGVDKFIEIAEIFQDAGLKFEIYGPDGGELSYVQSEMNSRQLIMALEYKGPLRADQVQSVLADIDLLILPSKDEPFPMVILEALAVGTPVLIMPSCGFAGKLKSFESSFVAETEDICGLVNSLKRQKSSGFQNKSHLEITNFCAKEFGIKNVVNQILDEYQKALSHEI